MFLTLLRSASAEETSSAKAASPVFKKLLETVLVKTRIDMDAAEKNRFYEKHLKNMLLTVSKEGVVNLELKR